jgi:prepilin-type processing-associated H-X9-DG protein
MLLPALSSARDKAKSIQCNSNVKNLGMQFIAYTGDFNGYFVPLNSSSSWSAPIPRKWYPNILSDNGYLPVAEKDWYNKDYGAINKGIWRCPSVGQDYARGGYGPDEAHLIRYGKYTSRITTIKRPSAIWLIGDAAKGIDSEALIPDYMIHCPVCRPWHTISADVHKASKRHMGKSNAAFIDGHCDSLPYKYFADNTNDVYAHNSK